MCTHYLSREEAALSKEQSTTPALPKEQAPLPALSRKETVVAGPSQAPAMDIMTVYGTQPRQLILYFSVFLFFEKYINKHLFSSGSEKT